MRNPLLSAFLLSLAALLAFSAEGDTRQLLQRRELESLLWAQRAAPGDSWQQAERLSALALRLLPDQRSEVSRLRQETRNVQRLLQQGRAEEALARWRQQVTSSNEALLRSLSQRSASAGIPPWFKWTLAAACVLASGSLLAARSDTGPPDHAPVVPAPTYTEPVLRVLSSMLIVLDPSGTITAVNETTCERLGYSEADLVGESYSHVLASRPEPLELASVRDLEGEYRRRDGSLLPVRVATSVLQVDGQVRALVTLAEDLSESRRLEQALEISDARLRQTLDRLIAVREEERRRLARDLHDGMLQLIVAAQLQLQSVDAELNAVAPRPVSKVSAHLRAAVEEGRRLIQNLRPSSLEQLGLVKTLRLELQSLADETNCETHLTEQLGTSPLPPAVETTLYRVVQEALHNARKHAAAQRLDLRLESNGTSVTCEVRDDGAGFVPGDSHAGFGVQGMRERVELLGGRLRVQSSPGQGTRVFATIPLRLSAPGPSEPL